MYSPAKYAFCMHHLYKICILCVLLYTKMQNPEKWAIRVGVSFWSASSFGRVGASGYEKQTKKLSLPPPIIRLSCCSASADFLAMSVFSQHLCPYYGAAIAAIHHLLAQEQLLLFPSKRTYRWLQGCPKPITLHYPMGASYSTCRSIYALKHKD